MDAKRRRDERRPRREAQPLPKPLEVPLRRDRTDYPLRVQQLLKSLYKKYVEARLTGDKWANFLKYYQYLVRAFMSDPTYGIGSTGNARGLLIYHTMGLGKTFAGIAIMLALWDNRNVVVLLPRSLQGNYSDSLRRVIALLHSDLSPDELKKMQDAAVKRVKYVSQDAYNAADQIARVGTAGEHGSAEGVASLDGKLLIVDEAHNLSRAIINSPSETANARRLYDMIMEARNLRLVLMTGTPMAKDPFELVPLVNMLAGTDLLPPQYEVFYRLYVDKGARRVKNRAKLANRLMGLVSHVTHTLPTAPPDADSAGQGADAKPRQSGGFPEELPTIIERVEMAPDQYRRYLLVREKEDAEGKGGEGGPRGERMNAPALALPGSEKKAMRSYFVKSRSLSNFAPPRDARGGVDDLPDSAFTADSTPKGIRIVKRIEKSPGSVLVYSQFREMGGLKVVARCLRRAGYKEFEVAAPVAPAATGGGAATFSDGDKVYDIEKLWALARDLPTEEAATSSLGWQLDEPCWHEESTPDLSPRMVIADPAKYPDHARRIQTADLSYPLLLVKRRRPDKRGEYNIADGMHRLAKAVSDGLTAVKVQIIPPDVLKRALTPDSDNKPSILDEAISVDVGAENEGDVEAAEPVPSHPPMLPPVVAAADIPPPEKRYAIISGEVPLKDRLRIQAIFNSPANLRGAIIHALLVTKTGAEGLDLKNVRQTHQLEPYWDKARDMQVTARAVRMGSHDALPVEDRDVRPFLYIGVANSKVKEDTPEQNREAKTIDEMFHERAVERYELILDFRRLLQSVSLECSLFGYGNCRMCIPTGESLFYDDPARDIELADPCEPLTEREVDAKPITVQGKDGTPVTYYYDTDASDPLGYAFFEFNKKLDGYVSVDPSDPIISVLLKAVGVGEE